MARASDGFPSSFEEERNELIGSSLKRKLYNFPPFHLCILLFNIQTNRLKNKSSFWKAEVLRIENQIW